MKMWRYVILFALLPTAIRAADIIFPYGAFGPQSAAYELIGMEWWQWESHGDSRPRDYPIKVVVYWDQSLEQTKKKYPVDKTKEQDYRYVEYTVATAHLEKTIKALKEAKLDTSNLEKVLTQIRAEKKRG